MSDFAGLRVVAFEGRRVEEITRLIQARNGRPVSAPATRLELLQAGPGMVELAARLRDQELDGMLFLTEPGVSRLPEVMEPIMGHSELIERLGAVHLAARSPGVASALARLGLDESLVPEPPYTWESLVSAFDRTYGVAGREIAFQESGIIHSRMQAELMDRGAEVLQVAVYHWVMPESLAPLVDGIQALVDGTARVALFTNATQIAHVMDVAAERDLQAPLREALRGSVVGAIGEICGERLRAFGVEPNVIPEHPRLEELVDQTAQSAEKILESR